jgi:TrkA-N domain/RyR domain
VNDLHPLRAVRRVWRRRWQAKWRELRPLATILIATGTATLGTIGYLQYRGAHYGVLDALYRAPLLFAFGGTVSPPVPVTLQIARIVAPVVTGSLAVTGILRLSREQARVLLIRLLVGDHVVIAGIGATGSRLAYALNDSDLAVVVVERDPTNEHLAGCRERGITVLFGDASDPVLLRKAGVGKARAIVVVCGNDGRNIDIAAAAAAVHRRRRGVLTAFVHLEDLDIWRLVHEDAAAFRATRGLRLEFFNVLASGARLLLDHAPPFPLSSATPRRPHVLLVGAQGAGEQVVLYMARLWTASKPSAAEQLRITLAGAGAQADLERLLERYPPLARIAALAARPGVIESAAFQSGDAMVGPGGRCDITRAYVFLENEADALIAGLALHARPDALRVPVTVALSDGGAGIALVLANEAGRFAGIEPFGIMTAAVTTKLLLGGTNELLAQAKHADYVRHELALGHSAEDNPTVVPWDELHESYKESNRLYADGIGSTLETAGCVLVPLAMRDADTPAFRFTREELESLARREHDRWSRDLLAEGWRPTTGEKDAERKLHPLLVAWEDLSEADREKDRDAIRELPAMIELTGFRVQRPDGDGVAGQAPLPASIDGDRTGRA